MKAFKAYDIRGIYGVDFDKESVYKIGFFLPALLKVNKILVGRDIRLSSDEIYNQLTKGITDAGCDVYNLGLATTPMVYYFTAKHHYEASVQITASHNPKHYNGLKISGLDAKPIGYDTGLKELEYKVENEEVCISKTKGKVIDLDVVNEYKDFLLSYRPKFDNLNLVIDCSNGMANLLVDSVLGNKIHYINHELDGNFPSHEPNPLEQQNIVQLQNEVRSRDADVGVIFDGDADRVMFIDENANFVSPDKIIALLGFYFATSKNEKSKVLVDIRTSKSVTEFLQEKNYDVNIWKVGRAFAALKLREIDGLFGGELAGHYYFKDFFYSDSGILAAIIVLNIIANFKRKGFTFSQLMEQCSSYANSGEINYLVEDKIKTMEMVKDYFFNQESVKAFYDFDGYRLEFEQWWFNIRLSNTEPYLRLIVEAQTEKLLQEKLKILNQLIQSE